MRVQVSAPLDDAGTGVRAPSGLSFLLCPGNKGRLLVIFSVGRGKSLVSPLRRCPLDTFSFHKALHGSSWRHHGTFAKLGATEEGAEKWLLQGVHHTRQEQIGLKLMSYTRTH